MRKSMFLLGLILLASGAGAQGARRRLNLDDMARLRTVSDPHCSPGGHWVAYTVSTVDAKADTHRSHIWTARYDGGRELQMTQGEGSESAPRWSPDGKYLSFLSARPGPAKGRQVWLLDRRGGEARQLTAVKGSLESYAWSPDSRRLALVIEDPDPNAPPPGHAGPPPPPKPIVIDRYKFKEDRIGFLAGRQTYIYVFDVATGKLTRLTRGHFDESSPSWSPRGHRIAFLSNHDPHPERELDGQLYVIAVRHLGRGPQRACGARPACEPPRWNGAGRHARADSGAPWPQVGAAPRWGRAEFVSGGADAPLARLPLRNSAAFRAGFASRQSGATPASGAVERALTTARDYTEDARPAWSPDGTKLAFLEGAANKFGEYTTRHLAVVEAAGGDAPSVLTRALDRGVAQPRFSADGQSVEVLVADDRSVYPARIRLAGDQVTRLMAPPVVVSSLTRAGSCTAALVGHDHRATEVYALGGAVPRQLSHQNDALFHQLKLAPVQEVSFRSQDGTDVHGLLTTPLGYVAGTRVPLLLRIHGGPNGQDAHSFNYEDQMFAAHGYAVLQVNYRGSSGRGEAYSRAIVADWGHLEVQDLEAGVNHVIAMGIADPKRLGVGGWSYGAILTDSMIASDPRFRAATAGAGMGFAPAMYGVDEYVVQYDYEIGPPWKPQAWATYQKISYPFLHADRIKTPTLFLGGTLDSNVPLQGGQQMYEALRSLRVPTELIVYPGEWHGIERPSFQRDRMQRYLAWYAKYLKP